MEPLKEFPTLGDSDPNGGIVELYALASIS